MPKTPKKAVPVKLAKPKPAKTSDVRSQTYDRRRHNGPKAAY